MPGEDDDVTPQDPMAPLGSHGATTGAYRVIWRKPEAPAAPWWFKAVLVFIERIGFPTMVAIGLAYALWRYHQETESQLMQRLDEIVELLRPISERGHRVDR